MKYKSTRGGVSGCTFEEAIFSGYASDGGLFMPESVPSLDPGILSTWSKLCYKDLAVEIVSLFISQDEIPKNTINELLAKAFTRISCDEIIPFAKLKQDLTIAELFHGPTLTFKDLALSCVAQFYEYFLQKNKKHVTILLATSGDTGSAAIEAVYTLSSVDIVLLVPKGRCTEVQERQMNTVISDNVHVYRVEGCSDDLDVPIKQCFNDTTFALKHNLCSINSINWSRIMVQIVHFFYLYFQMCPTCDEEVEIVVPTGACGNVTGGLFSKTMGLPIKLICAVNTNDIVARTIDSGDFSAVDHVDATFASAMDIQIPYNIERILYLLSAQDSNYIKELMTKFEVDLKLDVPVDIKNKMQMIFKSFRGNNDLIVEAMQQCWKENEYLVCPHTALAVAYHYSQCKVNTVTKKRVCVGTASPAKFEEVIAAAGLQIKRSSAIEALLQKPTKYEEMVKGQDWYALLRSKVEDITQRRGRVGTTDET